MGNIMVRRDSLMCFSSHTIYVLILSQYVQDRDRTHKRESSLEQAGSDARTKSWWMSKGSVSTFLRIDVLICSRIRCGHGTILVNTPASVELKINWNQKPNLLLNNGLHFWCRGCNMFYSMILEKTEFSFYIVNIPKIYFSWKEMFKTGNKKHMHYFVSSIRVTVLCHTSGPWMIKWRRKS